MYSKNVNIQGSKYLFLLNDSQQFYKTSGETTSRFTFSPPPPPSKRAGLRARAGFATAIICVPEADIICTPPNAISLLASLCESGDRGSISFESSNLSQFMSLLLLWLFISADEDKFSISCPLSEHPKIFCSGGEEELLNEYRESSS